MNGEHGMWRKSNMYEASSRIPLQIAWPGHIPGGRRVSQNVSLVDLVATLVEVSEATQDVAPLDGDSLMPLLCDHTKAAESWKDEAFCEYLAHGILRPVSMLKQGDYKLNISLGDAPELFNTSADPGEFDDLAGSAEHQPLLEDMQQRLLEIWGDPEQIEQQVLESQRRRRFIENAGD
jgi:choline-sulfatase